MRISEILNAAAVRTIGSASSKKRVFQEIAQIAASCYGLDAQAVVDALNAREGLGPTGVGNGVALPHAHLEGLDQVRAAFILLEKPVNFEAIDRQPVDIVAALFAPPEAGVQHLKALATMSRTLRDKSIRHKLRSNPNPHTLYAILIEGEAERVE